MDNTPRLGLNKPNGDPVTGDFLDVEKLNENFDKLDAVASATECTSETRPSSPFRGQVILESDTGRVYVWGGSAWLALLIGPRIGLGTDPDANTARRLSVYGPGGGSVSQVQLRTSDNPTMHRALSTRGEADTQDRWWIDFDGSMQWGPGNAGGDTTLKRTGAGTLRTDGTLSAGTLSSTSATVSGTATVGALYAGNMASIQMQIIPTPNVPSMVIWNYGKVLPEPVRCLTTANTTVAGTQVTETSSSSIGPTQATIWLHRTTNTNTGVQCFAIGGLG